MKSRYLILFSLSGFILCLDQFSKLLVQAKIPPGETVRVFGDYLRLTLSQHSGMAFGLLERVPEPFQEAFFIGVPFFALVLIVMIFIKLRDNQYLTSFALTTILAGAAGNLVDRVRAGHVLNFIEIRINGIQFPSFNIADISILLGVGVMFYHTLRSGRNPLTQEPN